MESSLRATAVILLFGSSTLFGSSVGAAPKPEAAAPASADTAKAKAWVSDIYRFYTPAGGAKGAPWITNKDVKRYFEPALAKRILKDRETAEKNHDLPLLDSDPFVDGQDWDIKSYTVTVDVASTGKSVATVSFVSAGTAMTIKLDLVQTPAGWRIADIHYQDGRSLLDTLQTA
jgi:hypothetical protein